MNDELDYNDADWNYELVCQQQLETKSTTEIKGRIKLAEINYEERVSKIMREQEKMLKSENENSKIRILEYELELSKKREKTQKIENQKLEVENCELKRKINLIDSQYEQRKIEIYVAFDAYLMDNEANYDEFFESLKFR